MTFAQDLIVVNQAKTMVLCCVSILSTYFGEPSSNPDNDDYSFLYDSKRKLQTKKRKGMMMAYY